MGKNRSNRRHSLGPHEQMAYMRLVCRHFHCQVRHGVLTCRGNVKPVDVSNDYAVRIEYSVGSRPKVWVEGLPAREEEPTGRRIPHRFADGTVCLYYGNEWTSDKSIAQTIVPWLLEWLFFYEGWLATGEWQGGGTHPESLAGEPSVVESSSKDTIGDF